MHPLRLVVRLAIATVAAAAASGAAAAEAWPAKPITLVVTFGAGSGSDVNARFYARALKDKLGASSIVDLRPGAEGMIGAQYAAKAAPDGYTVLIGSGTVNAANYALFRDRIGYAPQHFDVVAILSLLPATLFVAKDIAAESVGAAIASAERARRKLSCGSGNAITQVACEILRRKTGADVVNVPYKGNAQSLTDLAGGQITFAFTDLAAAAPFMARGDIRPLAVANRTRHATLPEVKTFAEQGLADLEFLSWNGLFVPAGTPREIIARLNEVARAMFETPEWEKQRLATSAIKVSGDLKESQEFVAGEIAKWDRYVRETGVKGGG